MLLRAALACLLLATGAPPAGAQEDASDLLRDLGTARQVDETAPSAERRSGDGTIRGQVVDASTGAPVQGTTVILQYPAPDGGEARQEVQVSDAAGSFEFPSVPPGTYDISFVKSGYRNSTVKNFSVLGDQLNRADFPLQPLAAETSDEVLQLEEFVVEAETVAELMTDLETRLESDQLLNILSAEDFSKFAASDVGEALERVAGINIVEGQFAIIRGLEDRYSSTTYNGAPVPSPDPDRQSVQLDLFPAEVVTNLTVAKSGGPELPGNSAGGSIDIVTHDYPEETLTFSLKAGTGYHDRAKRRFLSLDGRSDVERVIQGPDFPFEPGNFNDAFRAFEDLGAEYFGGSPVGNEDSKSGNFFDDIREILESDYVATMGGRLEVEDREVRYKGVLSREKDYSTSQGFQQSLEPDLVIIREDQSFFDPVLGLVTIPGEVVRSADLVVGELSLNEARYDLTTSTYELQETAYGGFGFDLDDEGNHQIDASVFFTRRQEETVQLRENGFIPGLDYLEVATLQADANLVLDPEEETTPFFGVTPAGSPLVDQLRLAFTSTPARGSLAWTNFTRSQSFQRDRELKIYQINGQHGFEQIPGLNLSWATNWARTTEEQVSLSLDYFFEPCGQVPTVTDLGCPPGASPVNPFGADGVIEAGIPPGLESLGPGLFSQVEGLLVSATSVDEVSRFYRGDVEYEFDLSEVSRFFVSSGFWAERATREVDAAFLESPAFDVGAESICTGAASQPLCLADSSQSLGSNLVNDQAFDPFTGIADNLRTTQNESTRNIDAFHMRGKWTLWERLDLFSGVRYEDILIESQNDPFARDPETGENLIRVGGVQTFPSRFLLFDREDNPFDFTGIDGNPAGVEVPTPVSGPMAGIPPDPADAPPSNADLLGLTGIPTVPCPGRPAPPQVGSDYECVQLLTEEQLRPFFNGRIDEEKTLWSAGFNFRPIEGMSIRGAWSETVARPSFRELGYYVTVEPGSDDLVVGNPQLQLSEVESWDGRIEYSWGTLGDLVAVSIFQKDIQRPIESILIRDPLIETGSLAEFRTFFNNPNQADLRGIEAEFRKSFTFFGWKPDWLPDWLQYLSIGGNFTYIDAEVDRTEAELARSRPFFSSETETTDPGKFGPLAPGDVARFDELEETRRLFNQPEWIANADLTFDHPDWGTKFTIAYFRISDVLDAAGSASFLDDGTPIGFTLDRYVDEFSELRATFSQTIELPNGMGSFKFSASAKNITDSTRAIIYDPEQTRKDFKEREFKTGRDFSISLTYTRSF